MACTKCISINHRWCRSWCAHCPSQYVPSLRNKSAHFFLCLFPIARFNIVCKRSGVSKCSATDFNPQLSSSQKFSEHFCRFMLCSHILDFWEHCPACVVPLSTCQLIISSHVFAEILKKVVAWVAFGSANVKCVSLARPSCKRAKCETTRRLTHVYPKELRFTEFSRPN